MNNSGIEPSGYHVLVKPDPTEEKSSGGIILPETSKQKAQDAQVKGTLVAVGPVAWRDYGDVPWASPGDRVLFAKYGGYEIEKGGEKYRVLNDTDITAKIIEE